MTFTELDHLINESGRRSLASRLISALLDALDAGEDTLSLDVFERNSGYTRTNIRTVASFLSNAGVINILYLNTSSPGQGLQLHAEAKRGRWARHHYALANHVRELHRR